MFRVYKLDPHSPIYRLRIRNLSNPNPGVFRPKNLDHEQLRHSKSPVRIGMDYIVV